MKMYSELTIAEKTSMLSEDVRNSIVLQCINDGFPYPEKPKTREFAEVPHAPKGQLRYFPQIKFGGYWGAKTIPVPFKTPEEALNFFANCKEFPANEDSDILSSQGVTFSTVSKYMFYCEIESKSKDRELALDSNSAALDYNNELIKKYESELDAFNDHAKPYFEEYETIMQNHYNLFNLHEEYKKYLNLCDGNESIAEKIFRNARPLADFDAVKNFKA